MRRAKSKWVEMIFGVLMILLGIFTLIRPNGVLSGFTICYAIIAILTGARDLMFYCKSERYTGFRPCISLVAGILSIMSGIMLIAYPRAGVVILSLLVPIWIFSHSIFQLISADCIGFFSTIRHERLTRISGILGLILGFILLFNIHLSTVVISVVLAAYLIISGCISIMIAGSMD